MAVSAAIKSVSKLSRCRGLGTSTRCLRDLGGFDSRQRRQIWKMIRDGDRVRLESSTLLKSEYSSILSSSSKLTLYMP